ncbi:SPOR domain-containing protein [Thalassobaculum sp. OXR-137]|uniref:SPOR domain-containing protein n=1 Tax=Thalassobaculum sp. OXR-137 TaxID=3100173 RepID=UPI002AC92EF8|nr:SPOR domain-containing protein [Thalassobaculum sp. OXR-137]WPZ32973.1 SPOR domain-containing protein [Thalassobaculum sp. OXR-137]
MSQDGDGLHADGYDRPGPPPELRDPPRRSRAIGAFLATFALTAFAGVVWYAYDRGLHAGSEATAPLIQADPSPIKVRPEQPGGLDVPNQDKLVYGALRPGQGEDSSVERLLPPPEKPAEPPAPEPAAAPAPQPGAAASETASGTDAPPPADGNAASTTVPIPPRTPQSAPSTVQEGSGQTTTPGTLQPVPAPQPQAGDIPPAKAPEPATTETQVAAAVPPPAPEPKPEPKPEPEAKPTPAPAPKPAASGNFRVQLGAFRDEAAARSEWNRLTKRYPTVLGGLELRIQSVDLGAGKGVFHRIQGGMLSEAAAEKACASLKAQNQACLLVRP